MRENRIFRTAPSLPPWTKDRQKKEEQHLKIAVEETETDVVKQKKVQEVWFL